jgi:hypothetical protein
MGYLRNAFLSVALATTVLGVGESAFAQTQSGPPPTPDAQTLVQEQERPWANDPRYVDKIRDYDEKARLRIQSFNDKNHLQQELAAQRHRDAVQAENNKFLLESQRESERIRNSKGKVSIFNSRTSQVLLNHQQRLQQLNTNYETQRNSLEAAVRNNTSQENIRRVDFVQHTDQEMVRLPEYKNSGFSMTPSTQPSPRPGAVTKSANEMSPAEKAHADAVKRYNDDYRAAQVRIARGDAKAKLPDPTSDAYQLAKDDPDITPNLLKQYQNKGPTTQPRPQ